MDGFRLRRIAFCSEQYSHVRHVLLSCAAFHICCLDPSAVPKIQKLHSALMHRCIASQLTSPPGPAVCVCSVYVRLTDRHPIPPIGCPPPPSAPHSSPVPVTAAPSPLPSGLVLLGVCSGDPLLPRPTCLIPRLPGYFGQTRGTTGWGNDAPRLRMAATLVYLPYVRCLPHTVPLAVLRPPPPRLVPQSLVDVNCLRCTPL